MSALASPQLAWALLAVSIAFNVSHNALLKAAAALPLGTLRWATLGALALALGGLNALCFSLSLRSLHLGLAYPAFAGASVVLTLAGGRVLFSEPLSWQKLAGASLVVAGIALARWQGAGSS
ncbi:MAG: hypothetical protein IPJ65_43470 [Archangiaceae bacterium]|nr:hypothetical protein [Archangiaceae bacterium]